MKLFGPRVLDQPAAPASAPASALCRRPGPRPRRLVGRPDRRLRRRAVAFAELQLPGRKRLPAAAVLAGRPIPPGTSSRTGAAREGRAAGPTSRQLARAVLEQVEPERAFANRALSAALDRARALSPEERALATELVYGVLRRQARLDRALEAISDRGLSRPRPAGPHRAARGGLSDPVSRSHPGLRRGQRGGRGLQDAARRAAHRAASPTRSCAGWPSAASRRCPTPPRDPLGYLVEADGLPEWLARLALGELAAPEAVAFARRHRRAGAARAARQHAARRSRAAAGAPAPPSGPAPSSSHRPSRPTRCSRGAWIRRSPTRAFAEGLFAVEDVGAQVVAELCGAAPGERILDACAGSAARARTWRRWRRTGARIDAADIAPAKLSQARELGRAPGRAGRDHARRRSDAPAGRRGAALPPRAARRALRRARRAAPPPRGALRAARRPI